MPVGRPVVGAESAGVDPCQRSVGTNPDVEDGHTEREVEVTRSKRLAGRETGVGRGVVGLAGEVPSHRLDQQSQKVLALSRKALVWRSPSEVDRGGVDADTTAQEGPTEIG